MMSQYTDDKIKDSIKDNQYQYCIHCGRPINNHQPICDLCSSKEYKKTQINMNQSYKHTSFYRLGSIVLGAVGTILVIINYFGIPFLESIGISLGFLGLYFVNKDKDRGKYFSRIGHALSTIAIGFGLLAILLNFLLGCVVIS
jgi:hypothetical protein